MYKKYQDIIIDGTLFKSDEFEIKSSTPRWKQEVYEFINEWLDDQPTIKAHTSGTTGTPKTILLKKEKMIASALKTGAYFNLQKNDKALLCLSPSYIAGKMMIVRAFVLQLNLIIAEPTGHPLKNLAFEEIDFAAMVPLQALNSIQNNITIFRKIKTTIIGGGAVNQTLLTLLQKEPNNFYSTYGMTETITHIAVKNLRNRQLQLSPKNHNKQELSPFETLPNVQIKKDPRGCLVINAPDVAEETIITNDLVEIISPTKFRWLGRYDNIINTGGIKVIPEKIETTLEKYLDRRFFISSQPDEKLGEKIILIMEGPIFDTKEREALNAFMESHLTKYSIPKTVFFIEKFIETDSGKIKRMATQELILS